MPDLYEDTMDMLNRCPKSAEIIAVDAKVSDKWIRALKEGRIKEPGVFKMQKLHNYLLTQILSESA